MPPDAAAAPVGATVQTVPHHQDRPEGYIAGGGRRWVPAAHAWRDNAELIVEVAKLGYLDGLVVDATYGLGRFWARWRPARLIAHDIDPAKGDGVDLRRLPESDASVDVVVLDPPYKLNGTPSLGDFDHAYGVHEATRWQDRVQLILDGIVESARVLRPGGRLLLKVQDQVVSGAVRWLTVDCTTHAAAHELDLVDRFDLLRKGRPQPAGRRQVHAHGRPSTLLVFRTPAT
jgi:SAM-dependent methyltransferase